MLAPNHRWRGRVTPAKRGKGAKRIANTDVRSPAELKSANKIHMAAQRSRRYHRIHVLRLYIGRLYKPTGVPDPEARCRLTTKSIV